MLKAQRLAMSAKEKYVLFKETDQARSFDERWAMAGSSCPEDMEAGFFSSALAFSSVVMGRLRELIVGK